MTVIKYAIFDIPCITKLHEIGYLLKKFSFDLVELILKKHILLELIKSRLLTFVWIHNIIIGRVT